MQFKSFLAVTAATVPLAFGLAAPAFAQSTGTIDSEKEIVVTGTRSGVQEVGGISSPDTSKAKSVLTSENIQRQNPGQSILDTINQVPGVSFQNNDAYGSSGGTLNIRGFSSDRVSLTFDGVPLNDSGNYAIFSNQQVDPELLEQVNVNLGTTDVDSPTASAAGGTVNLRTKKPDRDFGAMLSGSAGQYDFMRMFGKIETGDLTPGGIRAWVSASMARNSSPFNNVGKVDKQQYNGKLYVPLAGDDFISIAGHWNQNRNNFFGSLPLRLDTTRTATVNGVANVVVPRIVGPLSQNRYPANADERQYLVNYPCSIAVGTNGVADGVAASRKPDGSVDTNGDYGSCGTEFDRRFNPSNTGNIRINMRYSLADNIVLTIDPSFQYVKANGGGTTNGFEGLRDINPAGGTAAVRGNATSCATVPSSANNTCVTGYLGGNPYFGRDINGDGDTLDTVTVVAPSQTQTKRYGVIAGLRYEIDDSNTLRIAYTWDRARHRQTGEVGLLLQNGNPIDVFPVNSGQADSTGAIVQKRDRLSYAILHQVSGEYRGEFFDNRLVVNAGLRMPFFKRDLTNNCFTSSASGFVECFSSNTALGTTAGSLNPYSFNATNNVVTGWAAPQKRVYNYKKALPNIGFTYNVVDSFSVFGNFSQGISVPGTDNLYNAFFYPVGTPPATPAPETTDNFDLGVRYRSGNIQAQLSGFYNQFHNRSAQAYDPELNQTVYRNLGDVKKYGMDGSIAWQPMPALTFYAFGSILKSEIKDNVVIGRNSDLSPIYALTAGKRESGAPKYTFGFTARGEIGPVELGITAKRTGERYVYDTNEAVYTGTFVPTGAKACATVASVLTCGAPTATAVNTKVYEATAAAYWLVNLDARLNLSFMGLNDKTYLQLNVYNLFDQFYVGGFGGGLNQALSGSISTSTGGATYGNAPNVQIGAPRTISGTVVFAF
ncbi:TonB-dependent receptor domain-containing protein [Novosphingobium sp.]|uniref:TonB-dependent receptor n=1 Tax=Novosphingobium sp. TaxID=1874826 RepID=UPI00286DBE38|nr:TonB-dependent receptor [Novosphingobium sp.]